MDLSNNSQSRDVASHNNEMSLPNIEEDKEMDSGSEPNRHKLKIKESLTRDFSIENLKRAADNTVKRNQMGKPTVRNLSMDQSPMHGE